MLIAMVVPTYWSRPSREGWRRGDLVFDHPTPLDGGGTLGRLLRSIDLLDDKDFELALVVVPTTPLIEEEAVSRVRKIAKEAGVAVPTRLLTPARLRGVQSLPGAEADRFEPFSTLSGYPHARNGCLLAASSLGADIALLIDDDELFEDPGFLGKVRDGFRCEHDGRPVLALAGYYLNQGGDFRLGKPTASIEAHWPKIGVMNMAFEKLIGRPPRYKATPFAFGGNLSLHRDLYTRLPFDTRVTRGEDLDYLMMALMHGVPTVLDNELSIRHEAPPKSHPRWQQMRQDAIRFAYQRAKLRAPEGPGMRALGAEDLDPYPGFFLRDDLEERIAETCRLLAEEYREAGDEVGAGEAMRTIEIGRKATRPDQDPVACFLDLRDRWQELMGLRESGALRGLLD